MFDKFIEKRKDEMIDSLSSIIAFPSVSVETNNINEPFGTDCNAVLKYVLDLGKRLGFRTKNIDGYCGYIEFGEGDELVGIIGHLDVVPADDNWSFPPFKATIKDNKIYGRGAIDDKGPVIASLYAMKAVMDTIKIHKRVRLILGLNEEKDWKCIEYYKKHEELPTVGFSPDADFPCIYAEKGLLNVHINQRLSDMPDIKIVKIDTNNNAINVVPKFCSIKLETQNVNKELINFIQNTIAEKKLNIKCLVQNNTITIESYGKSAHAAHPDLGINAISNALILLNDIYSYTNINFPILNFFNKFINIEHNGKSLAIDCADESGSLTLNVGTLSLEDNTISIGLNLRIPVNTNIDNICNSFNSIIDNHYNKKLTVSFSGIKSPLYIDKNNKLVQTLCNIFNNYTNSKEEPIAIGGATYARAFNNCISFGANFPGDTDMCHQVDEFISIDKFILSSKIYAKAIYELTK